VTKTNSKDVIYLNTQGSLRHQKMIGPCLTDGIVDHDVSFEATLRASQRSQRSNDLSSFVLKTKLNEQ